MGCRHPLAKKSKIHHPYEQLQQNKPQAPNHQSKRYAQEQFGTLRSSNLGYFQATQPDPHQSKQKANSNLEFSFTTSVIRFNNPKSNLMSNYPEISTNSPKQRLMALLENYYTQLDQLFHDFQQYLHREMFSIHRIAPTIYRQPKRYFIASLFHLVQFHNIFKDDVIFAMIGKSMEEEVVAQLSQISRKLWVKEADTSYPEEDMLTVLVAWLRDYKSNTEKIEKYLNSRFRQ